MNPNQKLIDSLRQAADFLEARPELPACHECGGGESINIFLNGRDEDQRRELKKICSYVGGERDKNFTDTRVILSRKISECFDLQVWVNRTAVCRKVVTTETVPAKPERVLPAEPEQTVEKVEWVCDEPLLAEREAVS